ncbi:MAG: hypothetical protein ACERKX_08515 [Anaerolineales bacterium]
MLDPPSNNYRSLIIAAIIMAVVGWVGLIILLFTTLPTVGPRWLFFFLSTLAITGTALPFVWLLHRRFSNNGYAPSSTLLREALLFTLYVEVLIWLQFNRSLSLSLAILFALSLIGIEYLLRILERSRWRSY